uniref:Tektin n=1 Tax=Mola mola TaxID=94237 RepID=A0A3Q3WTP5_MOLML
MCALSAKPGLRHSVSEWDSNNQRLSAAAQKERDTSEAIREEGRSLRDQTGCKTTWDERDTSRRLNDRAWDVARCKEALENCAQKLDAEMEALTLSKEQTEEALAATAVPLGVSAECLTLRDGRRGYELVVDPADEQLNKEVALIESVQQVLQQHVDKAFEQLCVLQEARHHLTADLQNKQDALDIDLSCLSLTVKSPQISLKTNPTRIPSGSSTPQEWLQFSLYNVARAQEAMQASQRMREDVSLSRTQVGAGDASKPALQDCMKQNDIQGLDADLQAKTASLKLAHTRLENRTRRPGVDLCRDEVQHGLIDEAHQLEATITALEQKLSDAQHSLQKMKLHHSRMLQDLSRKQEALTLDQRSMNTRTRLRSTSCTDKAPALLVPLTNSSGRSELQLLAQ